MNETVLKEVKRAYADCRLGVRGMKIRNLDFKASEPVSVEDAIEILDKAHVYYNAFKPSLLKNLPPDAMVRIAREGSVCLYLSGFKFRKEMLDVMGADEFDDMGNGEYRMWFD
jgi:hypothetical protein